MAITGHRASERSFYDRLQSEGYTEARELLERLLSDPTNTYERICIVCKSSGLFENLKDVAPQDLTRYRQRQAREESRASVMSLIESESETLLKAATKNPTGVIATYLRKMLAEEAVARFDAEVGTLDPVQLSKEAARHAQVEQRDRKLDLDGEKLKLDAKRLALRERQTELQNDKFNIASDTWMFVLR